MSKPWPNELLPMLQPGDLVLTLGAGNIVKVGEELLFYCRSNSQKRGEQNEARRNSKN